MDKVLHCDWGHESHDVRRLPRESGGSDWICYDCYLKESNYRDVPPWDTLFPQGEIDRESCEVARRAAELILELQSLHSGDRDDGEFSLVSVSVGYERNVNPAIHLTATDLETVSSRDDWEWTKLQGNKQAYFRVDVVLWDVHFFALIGLRADDPYALAESYGCPDEVLR